MNQNKFAYYNYDNLNYTTRKPNVGDSTRINNNEIKETKVMNSTMTNSTKKILPYTFHRSNSDHYGNTVERVISSDKKSSSQLITLEDSIKAERLDSLKGSCKSLL